MAEFNRKQAFNFINQTYSNALGDQLQAVYKYYNGQIKDPSIQKVQFYFTEALTELIEIYQALPLRERRLKELIKERDKVLNMLLKQIEIGGNINHAVNIYHINNRIYEFNIGVLER